MRFILFVLVAMSFACTSTPSKIKYNKNLDGYSYPFPVQTFEFKSQKQDVHMAYMDLNSSSKQVIVLLHGKNFAGYYWDFIAKDLVDKGYRVIIPDQIGFGKSSKPKHYQYSFYQLAHNTIELLNSLSVESFTIIGHSMGGMLATHLTYYQPNRVKKLVLLNSIGLEPYLQFTYFKDPEFFYNSEVSKTPVKMRNYQKKNYYDGKWEDAYEKLLIPHIGQMNHSDWKIVAWHNALTYGPIFNEDITSKMASIGVPTRIINGTRDRTGPGRGWKKDLNAKLGQYENLGKETQRRFPNAKLYELSGLGHMPHYEDYERFKKVFFKALVE
tara:strand:- start:91773 stop:92753 length:981 start_codon:yes stop_codon:yes gene_type:complete